MLEIDKEVKEMLKEAILLELESYGKVKHYFQVSNSVCEDIL